MSYLGFDEVLSGDLWLSVAEALNVIDSSPEKVFVSSSTVADVATTISAIRYFKDSFRWRSNCSLDRLNDEVSVEILQTQESHFPPTDLIEGPVTFQSFKDLVSWMTGDGKVSLIVISDPRHFQATMAASICSLLPGGSLMVPKTIYDPLFRQPPSSSLEDPSDVIDSKFTKTITFPSWTVLVDFKGLDHHDRPLVSNLVSEGIIKSSYGPMATPSFHPSSSFIPTGKTYSPLLCRELPIQPDSDEVALARSQALEKSTEKTQAVVQISGLIASMELRQDKLSPTAKAAFYSKGRTLDKGAENFPSPDQTASSPYIDQLLFWRYFTGPSSSFTDDRLKWLPWLDVLVNLCKRNPDLLYDRLGVYTEEEVGPLPGKFLSTMSMTDNQPLLFTDRAPSNSMIALLSESGDILWRVGRPLITAESDAMNIFRLGQVSRSLSLCRSSCDESIYVFARGINKMASRNFQVSSGPIIRALIFDPGFRAWIKGFNAKVMREVIRAKEVGNSGAPKIQYDPISWSAASALSLKPFLSSKTRRIGVYFGTFDPPHANHASLVNYALGIFSHVIVIPNSEGNEYKATASKLQHRLAMTQLAWKGDDRVSVVSPPGETKTWEGKGKIARAVSDAACAASDAVAEPWLILGEDSSEKAGLGVLKSGLKVMVFKREGTMAPSEGVVVAEGYEDVRKGLSSTMVRREVEKMQTNVCQEGHALAWMIDPKVLQYVLDHGLYRRNQTIEQGDDAELLPNV